MERIREKVHTDPDLRHVPEDKRKRTIEFADYVRGLQDKAHIHGHGVATEKDAKSILDHGLYTAWPSLADFTYQISEHAAHLLHQVVGWQYEARQYIVLIEVPQHEEYLATDAADENHSAWENREQSKRFAAKYVFEKAERPEGIPLSPSVDKRIPPAKIIGYWDDRKALLHINPQWKREGKD